jgi:hypothetical protein
MASQLDRIESRLTKVVADLAELKEFFNRSQTTPQPDQPTAPVQGAPDPAALALWLQPAKHPEETDEQHAARLAARDAALADWQRNFDEEHFDGPFKVWELTDEDMVYLATQQQAWANKFNGQDIMRAGLIEGKNVDLNRARNNGEYKKNNTDLGGYSSALKAEVERRLAE